MGITYRGDVEDIVITRHTVVSEITVPKVRAFSHDLMMLC